MRILFLFSLLMVGCSKEAVGEGPLLVQVPSGWHLNYRVEKGVDLYVLNSADQGLMMFSPWPEDTRPEEISRLVHQQAETVVAGISDSGALRLTSKEIKVASLLGKQFAGDCATLEAIKEGDKTVLSFFMFTDGITVWGGQFSGKTNEWLSALEVLNTLRKR